jgi:hypothetical protein
MGAAWAAAGKERDTRGPGGSEEQPAASRAAARRRMSSSRERLKG